MPRSRYLALFLLLLTPTAAWAAPTAILTDVKGAVSVVRGGKTLPAKTGFQLQNGDQIKVGSGSATLFSLSSAPRPLKANMSIVVGAGSNAGSSNQTLWKGVYDGIAHGYANRGRQAPATTRDGALEPVYPSQSKIAEARPVFSWQWPNNDGDSAKFDDYLVVIKTSAGSTVWSGSSTGTQLAYPADAPALKGALTWQVTPRSRAIDGTLQLKTDLASRPVGFTIATDTEAKALNADLANLNNLLKTSPQARTWARVALLRSRGFYAKALAELPAPTQGDETSLILRRDLLASSGQMAQLTALDNTQSGAAPHLSESIEKAVNYDRTTVPTESRKRYVAPDGAFAIQIPQAWGVITANLANDAKFYQWQSEFGSWPRFAVAVGPKANFAGKDFAVEMLTLTKNSGVNITWEAAQPTTFAGQQGERVPWTWVDPKGTFLGETVGLTIGDRVFAISWEAPSRDSNEYRSLAELAATLQTGVAVPPKQAPLVWDDLMKELDVQLKVLEEVNDNATKRESMLPSGDFVALDKARAASPPASRERARLAQQASLAASELGWAALQKNQDAEVVRWFNRSNELSVESYQQEKQYYLDALKTTDARIAELRTQTPPLNASIAYAMALQGWLNIQAVRSNDVMLQAYLNSDSKASTTAAQGEFGYREAALHSLALAGISDKEWATYRIRLINTISSLAYAAEARADFATARACYQRGISLRQEYPPTQDGRSLDNTLRDLANLDMRIGDNNTSRAEYEAALKALDESKPTREAAANSLEKEDDKNFALAGIGQSYALTYNNLGVLAHNRGDYAAAIELYHKALDAIDPLVTTGYAGSIRASMRAHNLNNIGSVFIDSGQIAEGLDYVDQAFKLNRQYGYNTDAAFNLINSAEVRLENHDLAGARRDAVAGRALMAHSHVSSDIFIADELMARIERISGNFAAAEKIATDGLVLAQGQNDLLWQASMARYIAQARMGALGITEENNKKATATQLAPVWAALHTADQADAKAGSAYSVTSTLTVKALAQQAGGDIKGAITSLENAVARNEAMRATAASQEAYSEQKSAYSLYDRLVNLLIKENRVDEAFDYLSRSRSKKLQDKLRLADLKSPNPAMQALLTRVAALDAKLKSLRSQLADAQSQPDATRDEIKISNLHDLVASTQAEFFSVSDQIKAQSPNFDKVLAVKPRELKKAQRALPPGALLLQYAPLGDKLYIFVVTRDDLKIYAPPVRPDDLNKRVHQFRDLIDAAQTNVQSGKPLTAPEKDAKFNEISTALYGMLLAPVQAEIDKANVVAIIPTQELFYLPFHALAQSTPTGLKFLIEQKPIAYLAAADVLSVVQARDDTQWGSGLLAMGDPTGANLPGALGEVSAIANVFPASDAVTGENATKATLLQPRNLDRRVLHFATHGVLDSQQPDQSYIQLAPNGGDDGKLRIGEIYGLNLNKVDLVTLSACRTALGQGDPDGSEITSLADSFSSAGTPTVVASLWSVEDQSTKQLMSAFYKQLADGKPKAEALRTAQLSLLKNPATRHPFYWAPFEMLGDWR